MSGDNTNNKVILANFKHLNPLEFKGLIDLTKRQLRKQYFFLTADGRLYVNSRMNGIGRKGSEVIANLFSILAETDTDTLIEAEKMFRNKFPSISGIDDWSRTEDTMTDTEKTESLSLCLIPIEKKRREIEARNLIAKLQNI